MTDQIPFPAIGDPPRLAEETAKADILNRVRTRDDRTPDLTSDLQPVILGEITALCTYSGNDLARYEWKRAGVLDDGTETAYADTGLHGAATSEHYPPLIEVNRLGQGTGATPPGDDPQRPSYKIGDRVLVHRIATDGGDAYVCESAQFGTAETPAKILPDAAADLEETDENADTWDQMDPPAATDGVAVYQQMRTYFVYYGTPNLYFDVMAVYRLYTYDSLGRLLTIGPEIHRVAASWYDQYMNLRVP